MLSPTTSPSLLRLRESRQKAIIRPAFRTLNEPNRIKNLSREEMAAHTAALSVSLRTLAKLIYEKLPEDGGNNNELQIYLLSLSDAMRSIGIMSQLPCGANVDVAIEYKIDAADSGFPLFLRDLQMLRREKEKATAECTRLRSEAELVEDAISMMAHGVFPAQPIESMQLRHFYGMLNGMTVPESLRFHEAKHLRSDERRGYYRKSIEYLDEDRNIPKFFTLYLTVPSGTFYGSLLEGQIEQAVRSGLGGLEALELEKVARSVEAIYGVQVQMAERYDIGPFWNRSTDNPTQIQKLLDERTGSRPDDSIIAYRKLTILRENEVSCTGLKSMWKALWSGDWRTGTFSAIVSSPDYLLMPHRLIQKAYNLDIKLGNNVRTYGIKTDGGILD